MICEAAGVQDIIRPVLGLMISTIIARLSLSIAAALPSLNARIRIRR
jgi:hypothetical protein